MAEGDVMIKLKGKKEHFRCECGANVFHHPKEPNFMPDGTDPWKINLNKYKCNGCGALYEGE